MTTITEDLARLIESKPINYAHRYGQLNGLLNFQSTKTKMNTTIEQDLAATPTPKPINYAYKYGQLNGLLMMLATCIGTSISREFLLKELEYAEKRRQEIANGEDEQ